MICPDCKIECNEKIIEGKTWYRCIICPFITSPSEKKIEKLYAVVAVQPDGNEGLVAVKVNGVLMSLVNSNGYFLWELIAKGGVDMEGMRIMEFTLTNSNVPNPRER